MNASDFYAIRNMPVGGRIIEVPSKELAAFLAEHGLAEPKSVEYRPHAGTEMGNCFRNVESQVERAGGQMETGWTFFETRDISIHTIAHAIWITRFGKRVDITPWNQPPKRRVLFLPDPRVAIKRGYTAGFRTIFAKDERFRAIALFEQELRKMFDEFFVGMGQETDIPTSRFEEAAERFGIPWEIAERIVDQAIKSHGH